MSSAASHISSCNSSRYPPASVLSCPVNGTQQAAHGQAGPGCPGAGAELLATTCLSTGQHGKQQPLNPAFCAGVGGCLEALECLQLAGGKWGE